MSSCIRYALLALLLHSGATPAAGCPIERTEHLIPGPEGSLLQVFEIASCRPAGPFPLVLLHGGGPGSRAVFDIPVRGYSLAEDLAQTGHAVYLLNLRGWEGSDPPPPRAGPLMRIDEAVADILHLARWLAARHGDRPLRILGWATGGIWASSFAASHPQRVDVLVLLNSLTPVLGDWSLGKFCGDLDALPAFRTTDAEGLLRRWDTSIPVDSPDTWRDPRVAEAYVQSTLTGFGSEDGRIRIPYGYWIDSCKLVNGRELWNPSQITSRVLLERGELDFWSRPEDLECYKRRLANAAEVSTVSISDGTHYLFLDRPHYGRDALLHAVTDFLSSE